MTQLYSDLKMVLLIFCFHNLSSGMAVTVMISLLVISQTTFAVTGVNPGMRIYKKGNVTIGGLFPVHVRGGFRSKLMSLAEAMVFAIEQINNDSKLLPNITLGYDITDTNLTNRRAMKTTLDYVNVHKFAFTNPELNESCLILPPNPFSPVVAVVGTGNSRSSILVSNLLEVEDIPLISYAATSDELSSSAYPSFFRTVPPDRFQSKVMADIAHKFKWRYVAAIAQDDAYGRSGIEFLQKHTKPLGICIAYENYFPANEGKQRQEKIQTIIEELKEMEEVGVIILYCTSLHALAVLREAMLQGLEGRTWVASEAWGNHDRVIKEKDLQPILQGMLGVVFTDITVPSYKRYLLSRTSAYRPEPWWRHFWEREFDCTFNTTQSDGIQNCSNQLKVTDSVFENSLSDSKATYVINAVYAIAHALDAIFKCKSPPVSRCPQLEPYIEPRDVLDYLRRVNFTSEVSQVSFDDNGDSLASYSIINYRYDNETGGRVKTVGTWEVGKLNLNTSLIIWNNGLTGTIPRSVCSERCEPGFRQTQELNCCWQCIRCSQDTITSTSGAMNCTACAADHISNEERTQCIPVPLDRISWGDPAGVLIALIACLGVVASLLVGLVFVWRNDTPIVKASNRQLSYTFLFCIGMNYLWALVNLAEPSDFICPLSQAWFYLFYTVAIVVLGVKTKRIVHLFEHRVPRSELTKTFIEKNRHILVIVGVTALDLSILILWFAVDIPRPHIDKSERTIYYLECLENTNVLGRFCQYLLIAILVVMSTVCCYFAFKSRKLPHNFNEGKFIAFALYVIVISWVTFYPVYLNLRGKYSVVISGAASIIAATGLLVCIFVPKLYIILLHPEKNTVAYMKSQISNHTFRRSTMEPAESRHRSCNTPESNATGTPTETPVRGGTPTQPRPDSQGIKETERKSGNAITML